MFVYTLNLNKPIAKNIFIFLGGGGDHHREFEEFGLGVRHSHYMSWERGREGDNNK